MTNVLSAKCPVCKMHVSANCRAVKTYLSANCPVGKTDLSANCPVGEVYVSARCTCRPTAVGKVSCRLSGCRQSVRDRDEYPGDFIPCSKRQFRTK
ncbi:hypothetical protein AVEN_144899-1 [Araneus ventricosus]|uniref:Uncharacterized protein n=1 Tax=Araneus ventricosus TaxID=182803 RepID=A0A4Y2MYR1_ARAVE|nr:hypothetical protein AVEN_144899-1 [Araneus ventricosus]